MRYKIGDMEIRSENAAKPQCSASAYLVDWLAQREFTVSALDFGCGKLRYTRHLALKSEHIGLLDSRIQLTREQRIDGVTDSITDHVNAKHPGWRIHVLEEFLGRPKQQYDFILVANVLSAIPSARLRAKSLRAISSALRLDGKVLFVNQHTNSYFTKIAADPRSHPHLSGWITQSGGSTYYYGILDKGAVSTLAKRYGLSIEKAWVHGQSNYVLASREEI